MQMLKYEKRVALAVEMKVYHSMLPSSSCRMKVLRTKSCQRDLDPREEEEGGLRTKHTSPEGAEVASHHQTDELTGFPLPGFGTTQPRGFPSAYSKKGSLKPPSLRGKHTVDGKRVVALKKAE